jgi:hypothetical protein
MQCNLNIHHLQIKTYRGGLDTRSVELDVVGWVDGSLQKEARGFLYLMRMMGNQLEMTLTRTLLPNYSRS